MRIFTPVLFLAVLASSLPAADGRRPSVRLYSPHGTVTIDTSSLVSSGTGPYTIDMQFIEGDGGNNGSNSVTLSNFALGGGSIATPSISFTGGVTVSNNPLTVTLVDSSFFQDVQFSFTPGNSLSFQFAATDNADPVAPDTFTLAILDSSGNEIPTNDPNGLNSFAEIDLPTTGAGTTVIGSGSTSGSSVATTTSLVTACDVQGNATAGVADVHTIVSQALGASSPANDVNNDGVINVTDIQLVINAASGQGCPVS